MRASLMVLGAATVTVGVARAGELASDVTRHAQENFDEFIELLAIPNVASEPQDIQRNAGFLEAAFRKRGFMVQRLDNPAGRPAVFAEYPARTPGSATVLLYLHFDGQPVIPAEWAQASPFLPVVKRRGPDGQWTEVSREALRGNPLDPELRVFGRAASDDKGPILMLLTAIDLLRARGETPAVNIKVLLDGEEEIGSPGLGGMAQAHSGLLAADAMVILDGPVHGSGRPTLAFGNRGVTQATLTVFGAKNPQHSGHHGNYTPNPAMRLARLLASMKDDDGRVLIAGYYDGVEITPADAKVLAETGDDEVALRRRLGIAEADKVGASYQLALQYPSLNVRGMASAGVGKEAANVVPSEAVAEFDLRTTPETDGRRLYALIREHILRQGYHLVDGEPTDAERALHPRLARFTLGEVSAAQRMPMDSAVGQWALRALRSATGPEPGKDPVRIRMMGGTVPTDVLVTALKLPFVMVPTVNPDNNQHARDENLRIGNFVSGSEAIYSLVTTGLRAND